MLDGQGACIAQRIQPTQPMKITIAILALLALPSCRLIRDWQGPTVSASLSYQQFQVALTLWKQMEAAKAEPTPAPEATK